jgi:hypothetical protein
MRSSAPEYYVVPDGFVELRRALEETVTRLFGGKYIKRFTKQSLKTELIKKHRQRRLEAATKLLLKSFQSGTIIAFLRCDGRAEPLDQSHWNEWESQWRPFLRDALGDTAAPVYLIPKDALTDFLNDRSFRGTSDVITSEDELAVTVIQTLKPKGRPKGTSQYPGDAQLVAQANALIESGMASSKLNAANMVVNPNEPNAEGTVDRIRKKIGIRASLGKNDLTPKIANKIQ